MLRPGRMTETFVIHSISKEIEIEKQGLSLAMQTPVTLLIVRHSWITLFKVKDHPKKDVTKRMVPAW